MRPTTTIVMMAIAAAPLRYPTRQFDAAVTSPMVLTPINSPNAHDTSMRPVTRPRRSYGTCVAIQVPIPR